LEENINLRLLQSAATGITGALEKLAWQQETQGNIKALKDLTAMVKDMTTVTRNLYELPTQAEAQQLELNKLKLQQDSRAPVQIVIEGLEEYAR
jgi:hypothetical protein